MDWTTYACPSPLCESPHWTVERAEASSELWRITASPTDPGFLVASSEPICPRCAERLLPTLELRGGIGNARHAA